MCAPKVSSPKAPPPPKPIPPADPVDPPTIGSRRRNEENSRNRKRIGTQQLRIGVNLPGSGSGSAGTNLPGA